MKFVPYIFQNINLHFRCYVEGCDVVNNSTGLVDEFAPSWLNNTLPGWGGVESSVTGDRLERQCYQYNHTWTNVDECLAGDSSIDDNQVEKCDRWVYDTSVFQSTLVTEVPTIKITILEYFLQINFLLIF